MKISIYDPCSKKNQKQLCCPSIKEQSRFFSIQVPVPIARSKKYGLSKKVLALAQSEIRFETKMGIFGLTENTK